MATELYKVMDDDVTLTAGAANHTSTVWHIPKKKIWWWRKQAGLLIKLTNGSTAPTALAKAQIQVSKDGTHFFDHGGALVGSDANGGSESWTITLPRYVDYAQVVSGSNTDQDVTIRVEGSCAY